MRAVSPVQASALFDAALGSGEPVLAALPLDRSPKALSAGAVVPPPLRGLVRSERRSASAVVGGTAPDGGAGAWRERLAALPEPERLPALRGLIRAEVAGVLGHTDVDAVDRDFSELGLGSLMRVMLCTRLSLLTGTSLAVTAAYDWPDTEQLAEHLYGGLRGSLSDEISVTYVLSPVEPGGVGAEWGSRRPACTGRSAGAARS
ncbi:beta-ketoacyl reductase [Streptomyces sp. AD2-2]|nr:beta-ketoacyl reductase [Streptomyces sp. AD2-2]